MMDLYVMDSARGGARPSISESLSRERLRVCLLHPPHLGRRSGGRIGLARLVGWRPGSGRVVAKLNQGPVSVRTSRGVQCITVTLLVFVHKGMECAPNSATPRA